MGDQAQQVVPRPVQAVESPTVTPQNQGRGNAAAMVAVNAKAGRVVDEMWLGWATQQVVDAAPQALAEYAAKNIPIILKHAAEGGITDPNQVAYLIATTEHETKFGKPKYGRSQTLVEDHNPYSSREVTDKPKKKGDKPTTRTQWSATDHVKGRQVTAADKDTLDTRYWDAAYGGKLENEKGTDDAARFRGRGFVQLTGRRNYRERSEAMNREGAFYERDGKIIGGQGGKRPIDLTANPEHVNEEPELAAQLLVDGARDGSFTGQSLEDHIPAGSTKPDFKNARSIINGDTKENGESIAATARHYSVVLQRSWPRVFSTGREGGPR